MKKVSVTIDSQTREVSPGDTILSAARGQGIFIPTFCHLKDLTPHAHCFVCVVEVSGQKDLVPACETPVVQGMVISTTSQAVQTARRLCLELLLSDHLGSCQGPCVGACPAGIDIPGFIRYLATQKPTKALELIVQSTPLPAILGRVCKRPCEKKCLRQYIDEPIAICDLKRFAADHAVTCTPNPPQKPQSTTGKRVAIVGAGPSGLTASYYLQLAGHSCDVFDAHSEPGGMLRYGIPSYRLPRDIIKREVTAIAKLGVVFHMKTRLGEDIHLEDLRRKYDAVLLGLGAQKAVGFDLPNLQASRVISGLDFLPKMDRFQAERPLTGENIIVVGGGDVAIDAARVARRSGAAQVDLYCLEDCDHMPAGSEAVDAAEAEGVTLHHEYGVTQVSPAKDETLRVTFSRCLQVCDENGHFSPQYDETTTSTAECSTLVLAIGQKVDGTAVSAVAQNRQGTLDANETTGQTNLPGVFAMGDCVTGPQSVVQAVQSGRQTATAVDQYLSAQPVIGERAVYSHSSGSLEKVAKSWVGQHESSLRQVASTLSASLRTSTFAEVQQGLDDIAATKEAQRCLRCGCQSAHECKLRTYATQFQARPHSSSERVKPFSIDESNAEFRFEAHKCISCRTCVRIATELFQSSSMHATGRGRDVTVGPREGTHLKDIPSAELNFMVNHCPVGALTRRTDQAATFDRPQKNLK